MRGNNLGNWFAKNITWILALFGIGCIAIAWVFYFYVHGVSTNFVKDESIWGAFGDFIGGATNPVIALLALIGLLVTIRLQQEEFSHLKTELNNQAQELRNQNQELVLQREIMDKQYHTDALHKTMIQIFDDISVVLNTSFGSGSKVKTLNQFVDVPHHEVVHAMHCNALSASELKECTALSLQLYHLLSAALATLKDSNKRSAIGGSPLYIYYFNKCNRIQNLIAIFNPKEFKRLTSGQEELFSNLKW